MRLTVPRHFRAFETRTSEISRERTMAPTINPNTQPRSIGALRRINTQT